MLVLVVLGAIGFAGYYVLQAKQDTNKTPTATKSATPAVVKSDTSKSSAPIPAKSTIYVKEWGIQIPSPSDDATYTYSVQDSADIWVTNQRLNQALDEAAKVAGQACGISGIQVFRTTPQNVVKSDPRRYTPEIQGSVYGLTQGPIDSALAPCSGKALSDAVAQTEAELANVWNRVEAHSN